MIVENFKARLPLVVVLFIDVKNCLTPGDVGLDGYVIGLHDPIFAAQIYNWDFVCIGVFMAPGLFERHRRFHHRQSRQTFL